MTSHVQHLRLPHTPLLNARHASLRAGPACTARRRCRALADEIKAARPGRKVLHLIDNISYEVCHVADSANFCAAAHESEAWRNEARLASAKLHAFIAVLNTDSGLYHGLRESLEQHSRRTSEERWTGEEVLVGTSLVREFEQAGMALGRDVQAEYRRLMQEEQALSSMLERSTAQGGGGTAATLDIPADVARAAGLELESAPPHGNVNTVVMRVDGAGQRALLRHARTPEAARRAAYCAINALPDETEAALVRLVHVRHEIARLVNYESYMEYALARGSLAAAPGAATAYLYRLKDDAQEDAERDIAELTRAARDSGIIGRDATLCAWHQAAALERLFSTSSAALRDAGRPLFSLDATMRTLFDFVETAFGVHFMQAKPLSSELWARDVTKLEAYSDERGFLGDLYLDFFRRPGKYTGNAHFMLRCGKELSDTERTLPICALVFAFRDRGDCITFDEVCTVFHEFGHALNTLMCDNRLQHFFGARGALDVIELPSHILESAVGRPAVFEKLLYNSGYEGGEAAAVAESVEFRSRFCAGLASANSLVMPLIDATLHGPAPPTTPRQLREVVASCQGGLVPLHIPESAYERFSMNHFVTYAGLFYAYKYAEAIASGLTRQIVTPDSVDGQAGRHIADKVFRPGGAFDAAATLLSLDPACLEHSGGGVMPARRPPRHIFNGT